MCRILFRVASDFHGKFHRFQWHDSRGGTGNQATLPEDWCEERQAIWLRSLVWKSWWTHAVKGWNLMYYLEVRYLSQSKMMGWVEWYQISKQCQVFIWWMKDHFTQICIGIEFGSVFHYSHWPLVTPWQLSALNFPFKLFTCILEIKDQLKGP